VRPIVYGQLEDADLLSFLGATLGETQRLSQ